MAVTLSSPLRVPQTRKKDFILNMNNYRNTHFRVLNNMKIRYKKEMASVIAALPTFNKIKVTFTLYPKTRRLCDVGNVCSIHSKFFLDSLVEYGKIEDDNYLFIPTEIYQFGSVDKDNPRVDITIEEIEDAN